MLEQGRGPKIIAFKKRRRKNSRRKRGHRQEFTLVRVTEILTDGRQADEVRRAQGRQAQGRSLNPLSLRLPNPNLPRPAAKPKAAKGQGRQETRQAQGGGPEAGGE